MSFSEIAKNSVIINEKISSRRIISNRNLVYSDEMNNMQESEVSAYKINNLDKKNFKKKKKENKKKKKKNRKKSHRCVIF